MKTSKLLSFLFNTHLVVFLGIFFLLHLLINLPFLWAPDESTTNDTVTMLEETGGKATVLLVSVILAPLFETFVYQFSVIKILRFFINNAVWCFFIAIPISTLFFAWDHSYSRYYQIGAFFIGLLYASVFYLAQYRRELPAFLIVLILHSTWNLFAFIMDEII
ncbi:MAG: CPBP family glutamic-type intramembrane protease [Bacteroidota bacterium]